MKIMEKGINITEILRNKPKGTKLYSPVCGKVVFDKIERDLGHDTIFVTTPAQTHYTFMEDGKYERNGECLLFPSKFMRDWSKFAWEEGDVLVCKKPFTTVLFAGFANEEYTEINTAYSYEGDTKEYYRENIYPTEGFFKVGEGDKLRFIAYLEKEYKGKLNLGTLEVEDIKPKWTPKPFDKVVARAYLDYVWKADFFSNYSINGEKCTISGIHVLDSDNSLVLPYNDETAKLIGTTKSLEDLK